MPINTGPFKPGDRDTGKEIAKIKDLKKKKKKQQ